MNRGSPKVFRLPFGIPTSFVSLPEGEVAVAPKMAVELHLTAPELADILYHNPTIGLVSVRKII